MPPVRTPEELSQMSAAKLKAYRDAWDAEEDAARVALIADGRGHETYGQTRTKAAAGDPAAVRLVTAREAAMAAWSEMQDRWRWHGSHKRIQRRFA